MSDEFTGYKSLRNTGYLHLMIDHAKIFVDGDIYTNTVESFCALKGKINSIPYGHENSIV